MKILGYFFLFLTSSIGVFAQSEIDLFEQALNSDSSVVLEEKIDLPVQKGKVLIEMSPDIQKLIEYRKHYTDSVNEVKGFRVQIFQASGPNSRSFALEEKVKFIRFYENVNIYMISEMPYFKIRVGDFRTRLQALGFMDEIKSLYPNAFVVQDKINITL